MNINAENRFWLRILSNHLDFILNKLSPLETITIQQVNQLQNIVSNLLNLAISGNESINECISVAQSIFNLKKQIIINMLNKKLKLGLPVTFINHMLTENEEYLKILAAVQRGEIYTPSNIELHLVWLPDAVGHAHGVIIEMDPVEKLDVKELKKMKKVYKMLHTKALEFAGYIRPADISNSSYVEQLDIDAEICTSKFIKKLAQLGIDVQSMKKVSIIDPLMLSHMIREELYYLTKLGFKVKDPNSADLL